MTQLLYLVDKKDGEDMIRANNRFVANAIIGSILALITKCLYLKLDESFLVAILGGALTLAILITLNDNIKE